MNAEEFKRARDLFNEICDASPEEQRIAIDARCADHPEARRIIEILLAEDVTGGHVPLPAQLQVSSVVSVAPEEALPTQIGRYTIIRECGRGGMGTVYEAEQDSPRRRVALKVIRAGSLSREMLRRFRYEAEILGRLQHPGIGQIFEAGSIDEGEGGQPYFAMEFIEGQTLLAYARDHELGVRDRLEVMARICDAVNYAHQQGVIHRDLKPANIIVRTDETDHGSSTSVGQPKILDFGVACATDSDLQITTMSTDVGQLVGTLQYMSPEQAAGDPSALDTRSDIYAIGIILYQLLTDRLPYDLKQQSLPQALRMIQEDTPSRLSTHDRTLRGDVETIVRKCLEKDTDRRYQSASELAEDIRRFMRDEPIAARPPSAIYQTRKFAQRNRALVGGILATILVLAAGVIVASLLAVDSARNAAAARAQAYRAEVTVAANLISTDPQEAMRRLESAPSEYRNWEWRHLMHRLTNRQTDLAAGGALVGRSMSLADGSIVAVREDGTVVRWDRGSDGAHSIVTDLGVTVRSVAFSEGLGRVAVVTPDDELRVYDLVNGKPIDVPPLVGSGGGRVVAWDGAGALVAAHAGSIDAWAGGDGWTVRPIQDSPQFHDLLLVPNAERAIGLVFHGEGARQYSMVVLIDRSTGRVLATHIHDEQVSSIAISPDGRRLAVGYLFRSVRLFDAATLQETGQIGAHLGEVLSVAFSPDGALLCSTGDDSTVRVWDIDLGESRAVIRADGIQCATFAGDSSTVLGFTTNGHTIQRWSLRDQGCTVLRGHEDYVYDVAWSPDGSRLASTSYRLAETCVWECETGELLQRIEPVAGAWPMFTSEGSLVEFGMDGILVSDPTTGTTERRPLRTNSVVSHFIGYGALLGGPSVTLPSDHVIWQTDYSGNRDDGFAVRASLDGALLHERSETAHPPFAAGPIPHPISIGPFDGAIAELIIFDGVLSASDAKAVEHYLAARRDSGESNFPQAESARLVAHFKADSDSVVRDEAGSVVSWTAANDAQLTLRTVACVGDVQFGRSGRHRTMVFKGQMEGLLPPDVQLGDTTIFWLGMYTPSSRHGVAYTIGLGGVFDPAFQHDLRSIMDGPLTGRRISNLAAISVDGVLAGLARPRGIGLQKNGSMIGWIVGDAFECVAFHPDGRRLATGDKSGLIEIWDIATQERVGMYEGHQGAVYGVAYSPDGTRLASGGNDTTVRIWDTTRGAQVLELRGHEQYVKAVAFSPDGTRLASGSGDRTVRIWNGMGPVD